MLLLLLRDAGAKLSQAELPKHPEKDEHLSCAPAPRLLPPGLGTLQEQVPLHLSDKQDLGREQGRL